MNSVSGELTNLLESSRTVPMRVFVVSRLKKRGFQILPCFFSSSRLNVDQKGTVIGVKPSEVGTSDDADCQIDFFTKFGKKLAKTFFLEDIVKRTNFKGLKGQCLPLYGLRDSSLLVLSGLGKEDSTTFECVGDYIDDGINQLKESIRVAASVGVKQLMKDGCTVIEVDTMGDPAAAAEGATLATYHFHQLKTLKQNYSKNTMEDVRISPLNAHEEVCLQSWSKGVIYAECQNLARTLMELPANILTPSSFCERTVQLFNNFSDSVRCSIRDEEWIRGQGMEALYTVGKGSIEPTMFLEIEYCSSPEHAVLQDPLVFVGKGVTFDSGGISIKPSSRMEQMKADMGGAACVVGVIKAVASLGAPGRVIGLIPLCENMPSGDACRPGDVVRTRKGLTIEVENTDAEGRLILCDALSYADELYPDARAVISIATLTGAMDVALGAGATGAFCASRLLYTVIEESGHEAGDRFWRMPLFRHYQAQIKSDVADIKNVGGRSAGACTAAALLQNFISNKRFAHLDIAGVMHASPFEGSVCPYLSRGMQGRPVRSLIVLAEKLFSKERVYK
ncbi:cytosol aminopeptidase-like [Zophobas morio]|uniref:cytosol aminopeptidase-like n=1 Tax=Zophobas morio TaxID=2755281 RepID=UPI00308282D3